MSYKAVGFLTENSAEVNTMKKRALNTTLHHGNETWTFVWQHWGDSGEFIILDDTVTSPSFPFLFFSYWKPQGTGSLLSFSYCNPLLIVCSAYKKENRHYLRDRKSHFLYTFDNSNGIQSCHILCVIH